jgi:hypothetical protein
LSYWPARLHILAKSIPRNRFLGSINVYKYGLCSRALKLTDGAGLTVLTGKCRISNLENIVTHIKNLILAIVNTILLLLFVGYRYYSISVLRVVGPNDVFVAILLYPCGLKHPLWSGYAYTYIHEARGV